MDDLIRRLEAATEGSRELDAEIAMAAGCVREREGNIFYGNKDHTVMVLERDYYDHEGHAPELPHYTTSLDAALTLAQPPGHTMWHWNVDAKLSRDHKFYAAEITVPSREFRGIQRTAALAICIAALKARSNGKTEAV